MCIRDSLGGVLGRTLGGSLCLLDGGLLGDGLANELDDRHGGVVTLAGADLGDAGVAAVAPVSYTHLTLPTSDLG